MANDESHEEQGAQHMHSGGGLKCPGRPAVGAQIGIEEIDEAACHLHGYDQKLEACVTDCIIEKRMISC